MYHANIDIDHGGKRALAEFFTAGRPEPFRLRIDHVTNDADSWVVTNSSAAIPRVYTTWADALATFRTEAAACVRDDDCA